MRVRRLAWWLDRCSAGLIVACAVAEYVIGVIALLGLLYLLGTVNMGNPQ